MLRYHDAEQAYCNRMYQHNRPVNHNVMAYLYHIMVYIPSYFTTVKYNGKNTTLNNVQLPRQWSKYTTTVKCTTQNTMVNEIQYHGILERYIIMVFGAVKYTAPKYHGNNAMALIPWYFGAVYFTMVLSHSLTHCCAAPARAVVTSTTNDPAPMTTTSRLCTRDPFPPVVSRSSLAGQVNASSRGQGICPARG